MNLRLVLLVSTIALGMAIATVYALPAAIESACWLAVVLACAFLVARLAPGKFFLHGLLVGLLNWVWVTASHVLLFAAWSSRHAQDLAAMKSLAGPLPGWMRHYGVPIPGASGVMIGALAWLASRIPALRRSPDVAR